MIRATMTAVPQRLPVLWAKAIVYGVVTLVLMIPAMLIAFFVARRSSSRHAPQHRLLAPGRRARGDRRRVYLIVVGLFGSGSGAIVRNTAGGIATFAGIMFVLPPLMNVLPTSWNNAITPYLPSEAGRQIFSLHHGAHTLDPARGRARLRRLLRRCARDRGRPARPPRRLTPQTVSAATMRA